MAQQVIVTMTMSTYVTYLWIDTSFANSLRLLCLLYVFVPSESFSVCHFVESRLQTYTILTKYTYSVVTYLHHFDILNPPLF